MNLRFFFCFEDDIVRWLDKNNKLLHFLEWFYIPYAKVLKVLWFFSLDFSTCKRVRTYEIKFHFFLWIEFNYFQVIIVMLMIFRGQMINILWIYNEKDSPSMSRSICRTRSVGLLEIMAIKAIDDSLSAVGAGLSSKGLNEIYFWGLDAHQLWKTIFMNKNRANNVYFWPYLTVYVRFVGSLVVQLLRSRCVGQ